jgi:hypothetical protein
MAVAPIVKYNLFIDELSKAGHNLATAVFKAALTNTAPGLTTDTVWNTTVAPAPAAAAGYTAGGNTLTTSSATTTAGVFKLVLADTVFTAAGGSIGPFRYVVIYNSSASNKVVASIDNGASVTLADTDTFTVDLDQTNGTLTVQ